MSNVIKLHRTKDIPMMLREMADRIEDGECGDLHSMFAFTVSDDQETSFFGWGEDLDHRTLAGILSIAASQFIVEVCLPNQSG